MVGELGTARRVHSLAESIVSQRLVSCSTPEPDAGAPWYQPFYEAAVAAEVAALTEKLREDPLSRSFGLLPEFGCHCLSCLSPEP